MVQVMIVALVALLIATGIVIGRKFNITGDRGLLWLAVALVVWPLVIRPFVSYGMGRAVESCTVDECVNLYPFTLVEQGTLTMGELVVILNYVGLIVSAALALIAVTQLYRDSHRHRLVSGQVAE